ncbi:unnamed protein product [Cylindrotheca closterium]|uniref:Uncharacterized protein n=1 Tax=Cylindrotheca closterium TaxID=2856 RepID=A0AAD2G129_9STRA|nr:unnamed protein product [Cylindrotheca closterium]
MTVSFSSRSVTDSKCQSQSEGGCQKKKKKMSASASSSASFFIFPFLLVTLLMLLIQIQSVQSSESVITTISSLDQLKVDENNRVSSHYLLYPEGCDYYPSQAYVPSHFEAHTVTGAARDVLFADLPPESSIENCPAVCMERGVQQHIAGAVLPHRYYTPTERDDRLRNGEFQNWFGTHCSRVEVCLLNYHDRENPLVVYWLKNDGTRVYQFDLNYGEQATICINSYIGHTFEVTTKDDQSLGKVPVEFTLILPFGHSPPSDHTHSRNFTREIQTSLRHEWFRQDRIKRTFSPLGFAKGRLPDDVFASLGALYYNNQRNVCLEEWGGKGVFVNWWETEVAFLQIPWRIKELHQQRLKDMVSEWAGVEVEETVMYGFRQYQEGARLLTHVDRHTTHAVSLIVNIAQGGLDEPWPVEVYDHGGRLHEVVMEPGDVVYYESAKNLHGRNRPLKGKNGYYVNLFTHYRPQAEGDDWWHNAEALPRSPPVMEAEGDCHLDDNLQSLGEQLGHVQCDDKRLGVNISPAMAKAFNAKDLIAWWEYTSPDNYDQEKKFQQPPPLTVPSEAEL